MILKIRPHHWFFALILSALLHGWVIYSVNFFQLETVQQMQQELPFTVLLSSREEAQELVLEDPESSPGEIIPLITLDENEADVETVELVDLTEEALGVGEEPLQWEESQPQPELTGVEAEELALDGAQAELRAPGSQVIKLMQSEQIEVVDTAVVPSLSEVAVISPESVLKMERIPVVPSATTALEMEPEAVEMAELAPNEMVPAAVQQEWLEQPQLEMPLASGHSEVVLAEITVEQIEFDETLFNSLPEVQAEDWQPQLSAAAQSQTTDTETSPAATAGWKRRYAGARGIGAVYRKQMRATLSQFVLYPKAVAEEQGVEGKVVVGFMIDRQGRLEETEILESSGYPALDQAVEKMVEFAQPFAALPKHVKNNKVRFAFPVTIKLKR